MAEQEEFDLFVRAHNRALLRAAWLLCADWHMSEDLVQQTLLEVWRRWARVRAMSNGAGYAYRLLLTAYTRSTRRSSSGEVPTETLETGADAYSSLDVALRNHTSAALRRLPPRQRAALVCRYFLDSSEQETAYLLNCKLGTVKSTTAKALTAMRRDETFLAWFERGEDNAHL